MTHINANAFEGCSNLQNVSLSNSLIRIETCTFKNCQNLTNIIIPNSVTNIDSNAFEGCLSLETILLSTNLHTIGIAAFKGCSSLSSVVLPSSVQYINDDAFKDCSILSNVTVERELNSLTNLGENVFSECNQSLKIIVPTNRIAEYKNKSYWSSYKNKIVASSDYSELELSCANNIFESINLESGYNKLYKVNVWCAKTYKIIINAQSDVNIKIYNYNMDSLIVSDNTVDIYLSVGTYYISLEFSNNTSYGVINAHFGLRWASNGESIAYNADNNVLTHFHKTSTNNYRSRLYYNNQYGAGLYKFTLTGTNGEEDIIYPSNCIVIYGDSSRTIIIDRYTISNQLNPAVTCENENEMYVFLPDNSYFYIDVNMDECNYSSLTLKVEKIDNHTFDYSYSLDYSHIWDIFSNQISSSYFVEATISHKSKFELDVLTSNNISDNIYIYILQKNKDLGYESEIVYYIEPKLVTAINSESNIHSFSIILDAGTYYIGYSNNTTTSVSFDLTRVVNREINTYDTLVSDPGVGVPLGSEVTLNNGLYEGSTITEGFTRNLYLNYYEVNDYEVSRLKYDWYSSDPEIASVTLYGTVLAKSVNEDNEVKIYAVSKEDPSIVYCKYITILNETSSDEIDIEFSITYSYLEENGTYKLQLDFSNSPYPLIQYYNWNVYPQDNINVSMNYWGEISSSGVGNAYIVGIYTLNPRVRLFINLTIVE